MHVERSVALQSRVRKVLRKNAEIENVSSEE